MSPDFWACGVVICGVRAQPAVVLLSSTAQFNTASDKTSDIVAHLISGALDSVLKHLWGYLGFSPLLMNYLLPLNGLRFLLRMHNGIFFLHTCVEFGRGTFQWKIDFPVLFFAVVQVLHVKSWTIMKKGPDTFLLQRAVTSLIVCLYSLKIFLSLLQYSWQHSSTWISRLQMKRLVGFNQCFDSELTMGTEQSWYLPERSDINRLCGFTLIFGTIVQIPEITRKCI